MSGFKVKYTLDQIDSGGRFVRKQSEFREIISNTHPDYQPEFDRYHLYMSYACPWANRCLAVIKMKGLEDCIKVSVTHPVWMKTKPNDDNDTHYGWGFMDQNNLREEVFNPNGKGPYVFDNCDYDPINGAKFVRDIYERQTKDLTKFTVPILFDKKTGSIVNNESSEIIRMFNTEFNQWAVHPELDFYPEALCEQIDAVNEWVYPDINDGVYKCGFAKTQEAYLEAVNSLFNAIERVEELLSKQRYLAGNVLTEADIRLFMTLVRFDEVYVVYFKCNKCFLSSYENLNNYMRELYQVPGLGSSVDIDHIKTHYFTSHPILNAHAVIPVGPGAIANLLKPHNRAQKFV